MAKTEKPRPVAAIAPGVLGTTGMETAEILLGLVRQIQPRLVIAVDALAARSTRRLGTTVQLADAGIHPGSGIGNRRFAINQTFLGVPCLAVGVPTVVHAVTIVHDALSELGAGAPVQPPIVRDVLQPYLGELVVTPKDIDTLVEDAASVVAQALDRALVPDPEVLNRALAHL